MRTAINQPIAVVSIYDPKTGNSLPKGLRWKNRFYPLEKLGYHHKVTQGTTLCHIFTMTYQDLIFRLRHDTNHLTWTLEEIADGSL